MAISEYPEDQIPYRYQDGFESKTQFYHIWLPKFIKEWNIDSQAKVEELNNILLNFQGNTDIDTIKNICITLMKNFHEQPDAPDSGVLYEKVTIKHNRASGADAVFSMTTQTNSPIWEENGVEVKSTAYASTGEGKIKEVTLWIPAGGQGVRFTSSDASITQIDAHDYQFKEISLTGLNNTLDITNLSASYYQHYHNLASATGDITNHSPSYYQYYNNMPLVTGDITNHAPSYSQNYNNMPLLTGDITNHSPSYRLSYNGLPSLTGDITNHAPSYSQNYNNMPLLTGDITNHSPSYYQNYSNMPLLTGDIVNHSPNYFQNYSNTPLLTGDITNHSASYRLSYTGLPLITGDITNHSPSYYQQYSDTPLLTGSVTNHSASYRLSYTDAPLLTGSISNHSPSYYQYYSGVDALTVPGSSLLSTIAANIDTKGETDGTLRIDVSGWPTPTGGAGNASIINLVAKGWTVQYN